MPEIKFYITDDERMKMDRWDFLENCLKLALEECMSILPLEDINEVVEKIDNREYLIALQSLSY